MDVIILGVLNRQEEENNKVILGIIINIENMKKILNFNDERLFFIYILKNFEFKNVLFMFNIFLLKFIYYQIEEEFFEEFGLLFLFKFSYRVDFLWVELFFQYRLFIKELCVIKQMDIEYGDINLLYILFCMLFYNDEDMCIWMCGDDDKLWFYDFWGELVKLVLIKFGNWLWDVVVIKSGDLLYIDYKEKIVNIVKNLQIQIVVRLLWVWELVVFCVFFIGDLLVFFNCDDKDEIKVV